ncbi:hypothetical protein KNE206_10540 [Kitasatospora sp. NE20-6]|uniref:type II secretion system F family protein n=1 Tax=Kitasatospora sp. NE20-6 TaxID=2859066 RepID=UPI0034DC6E83
MNATPAVLSALAVSAALLPGPVGRRTARRRLRGLRTAACRDSRYGQGVRRLRPPRERLRARAWLLPAAAGLAVAALTGGAVGLVAGSLAAALAYHRLPRPPLPQEARAAREQDDLLRQLPLAAELLAAFLAVSSSPGGAAAAVAASLEPPMRERLDAVAAHLALGAPPDACWEQLAADSPSLAPLARCLARTSLGGAPPSAALAGLAQAQRAAAVRAAHARVRRAGVLATAPLGLCFLPAFVLIGVVPVVTGLTAGYLRNA